MADNENIISLPELITELEQNRHSYVFFIGNSIPQIYGAKCWKFICGNLIKECRDNDFFYRFSDDQTYLEGLVNDPSKYPEIIMRCRNHFYKNNASRAYQKVILKALEQNGQQYKTYEKLFNIEPKHIITTNVDKGLLAQNGYAVKPIEVHELVDNHGIFYLHGSIDNFDEMVFPIDSYDRVYSNETFNKFLMSIFRERLLFIGYGLNDYDLLHYCRHKPDEYRYKLKSINLCGIPDNTEKQIKIRGINKSLWERFKIFTCEFPVTGNNWSKLIDIINEIHQSIVDPTNPN